MHLSYPFYLSTLHIIWSSGWKSKLICNCTECKHISILDGHHQFYTQAHLITPKVNRNGYYCFHFSLCPMHLTDWNNKTQKDSNYGFSLVSSMERSAVSEDWNQDQAGHWSPWSSASTITCTAGRSPSPSNQHLYWFWWSLIRRKQMRSIPGCISSLLSNSQHLFLQLLWALLCHFISYQEKDKCCH